MSIGGSYTPGRSNGDGSTKVFSVSFPFMAAADLVVTLFDTNANANVTPAPVLNGGGTYDFTASAVLDSRTGEFTSGTITFNNAPLANHKVIRSRGTAQTQPNVFPINGPLPGPTIEVTADRLEMQAQELGDQTSRALTVPLSDTPQSNVIPAAGARANKLQAYDGNGAPVASNTSSSQLDAIATLLATGPTLQGSLGVVATTAALLSLFAAPVVLPNNTSYITAGRTTPGDAGGGTFRYDNTDVASADNGGTIRVDGAGRRWKCAPAPMILPQLFGAKADGVTNDQAAVQAAVTYALSLTSGTIYFKAGTYKLNSTVTITHAKGLNMIGEGPDFSILKAGAFPAITTVGLWRSKFDGLQFFCSANTTGGAFQMDGETDGSFGVQGNTFINCMFTGNGSSKYCFTNCLVAGGNGQGSENNFYSCNWINPIQDNSLGSTACCFYNGGTNAVQNNIFGGNFQAYITGIYLAAGNVNVYSVGFQSTNGYGQIAFGGADIAGSGFTAGDITISDGCRSESLVHVNNSQTCVVRAFTQQQAPASAWPGATHAVVTAANNSCSICYGITAAGNVKLYRCTTSGTTGGSQPTWPESGTVADGTAVWTQLEFDVIGGGAHKVFRSQLQLGASQGSASNYFEDCTFSRVDVFNISNGGCPQFVRCTIGGIGSHVPTPGAPVQVNPTSAKWVSLPNVGNGPKPTVDMLSGAITWRGAAPGGAFAPYYDVALFRAMGDDQHPAGNMLGYSGLMRKASYTAAQLNAITPTGPCQEYCSDGLLSSNPLTGASTGCYCFWSVTGNKWVGNSFG